MTTKHRLITDSFKVVKKARKQGKREKRSPSPPPQNETGNDTAKEELELRQFDLDWRFGPCTGISRLQRWERANLYGLNPPAEIRELLLKAHNDPKYNLSNKTNMRHCTDKKEMWLMERISFVRKSS